MKKFKCKEIPRSSRSSNVEIQNAKNQGFSHVLEHYLNMYMHYHNKTTSLWIKNNASVKECNTQMDRQIILKVNFKVIKCRNSKCGKLGFLHVLEQYFDRYMKVYKKTISLWINNHSTVNKSNTQMD